MLLKMSLFSLLALILSSCVNLQPAPPQPAANPGQKQTIARTLSTQEIIRLGMSQDEVENKLGAPDVVSKDGAQKETWVYENVANEAKITSETQIASAQGLTLNGVSKRISFAFDKPNVEVRPLNVFIKFADDNKVESFNYQIAK